MKCAYLAVLISAFSSLCFSEEVRAMERAEPLATLVHGNNAFALDLYARIGHGEGNRFISPFSISAALAMTYAGAAEQTAVQIARTLHFNLPPGQLHPAFHQLIAELHSRSAGSAGSQERADVELFTANALWTQTGEHILPDFQKRIEVNYQGGLYPVDFRASAETARRTINTWVEERTKGKIQDLLKPEHIESRTVLVLTNAIYFKALWETPFSSQMTSPADFYTSSTARIRIDMMNLSSRFAYYDETGFQALELPYKGRTLAMVVLLPKAKDGLAQFESSLTAAKLEGWLSKLSPRRVEVSFPKFKLSVECELKEPLSELGMPIAFDPRAADFSGMSGSREFCISAVVHKAFVEVEEKGTEAAAATGVVAARGSAVTTLPTVFRADHPFVFLIRDTRNGSILFLGRLVKP
jgi:serpin B